MDAEKAFKGKGGFIIMEIYKDSTVLVEERVEDLLSKMTLDEKVAQLLTISVIGTAPESTLQYVKNGIGQISVSGAPDTASAVAELNKTIVDTVMQNRLGIPPIIHAEAITGLNSAESTIFPSAIGLGATFNPELVREMGDIIRKQMLAVGYRQALSPVMDVGRDPRWGRLGETYGEDPTLCAAMSVAYTKGLQSDKLEKGIVATGKHFLGYGYGEGGLNMASNPIPSRELREVYAKPFQAAITEAGLESMMNSYGSIDGDMIINSKHIMTELLRGEMKFDGITISDYMSIDRLALYMADDLESAGISALKAGLDIEAPSPSGYKTLADAVRGGRLEEHYINKAVRRILTTKFKLGLFENPYPHSETILPEYQNAEYTAHSLKAAREATVLVKNDGVLPLKKTVGKIAVVGPHANSIRLMFGCYTHPAYIEMSVARSFSGMAGMEMAENLDLEFGGDADDGFVQSKPMKDSQVLQQHKDVTTAINKIYGGVTPTILEALQAKCPEAEVIYAQGCEVAGTETDMITQAVKAAEQADVVIMTIGGKYGWGAHCTIGENLDTDNIGLTGVQEQFAKAILDTGVKTIAVHMDARPLSSRLIQERANAVIEYWFPGITGGKALADIIFGDYNPAGRMPVTTLCNAGQIPVYVGQKKGNSYRMNVSSYCDSTKEPLVYFGEGLSYTSFAYDNLSVEDEQQLNGKITVSCRVKNTGSRDGEEVVQLYVSDERSSMLRPYMELAGFTRVYLKAGQEKKISFTCSIDQFAFINSEMQWIIEKGAMTVRVGGSSELLPLEGHFNILESKVIEGPQRGFYASSKEIIL